MGYATKPSDQLIAVTFVPDHEHQLVWAYISDLDPLESGSKMTSLRQLYKELQELESACWRDGVFGWYCGTEKSNVLFIRWLQAVGATPFREDGEQVYFRKAIVSDPSPTWLSLKQLARLMTPKPQEVHA